MCVFGLHALTAYIRCSDGPDMKQKANLHSAPHPKETHLLWGRMLLPDDFFMEGLSIFALVKIW